MEKREILEIRKLFRKEDCAADRMRCVYVGENKERIAEWTGRIGALQDEEAHKYCEILQKTLSGRPGKTLSELSFPLSEEKEGGHQAFLYRLLKSGLQDDAVAGEFFDRVIDGLSFDGRYLVILAYGTYDIPGKTSDGLTLQDASEYVYEFISCAVCPVALMREGLCFDPENGSFSSRTEDWAVQAPDFGFLYPAFNDRNTDLHALLHYARNEACRHEEFSDAVFGVTLPRAMSEDRDVFHAVIEEVLAEKCDFEAVRSVSEAVSLYIDECKESKETPVVAAPELKRILKQSGAPEEALERVDTVLSEALGDDRAPFYAENVISTKSLTVKTDNLKLDVKAESSALVETRVIDGIEYFLIPVSDNVTVNGIAIRRSADPEDNENG